MVMRIGLDRDVGYANPNALAGWFGFCVVYLTIKGYVETRPAYRLASWLMAIGSLYIVTLTVSRGALLAVIASLASSEQAFVERGTSTVSLAGRFSVWADGTRGVRPGSSLVFPPCRRRDGSIPSMAITYRGVPQFTPDRDRRIPCRRYDQHG